MLRGDVLFMKDFSATVEMTSKKNVRQRTTAPPRCITCHFERSREIYPDTELNSIKERFLRYAHPRAKTEL